MRRTDVLIRVAVVLLADPDGRHWGYGVATTSGDLPGSVYPVLSRMESAGWLTEGWEEPGSVTDRPRRRYYVLTAEGRSALGELLRGARGDRRFAGLLDAQDTPTLP